MDTLTQARFCQNSAVSVAQDSLGEQQLAVGYQ